MKKVLQSIVLLLGVLMLPATAYAQDIYADVNGDLEVNIGDINAVIDVILDGSAPTAAADVNGDGEINIADINAVIDIILGGDIFDGENEGGIVDPTELEQFLSTLSADEENAPITTYSYADSLEYDSLAKEVIALFAPNDSDEADVQSYRGVLRSQSEDELAQDAIRNNSINIFESSLTIEQQDWDSGLWGKTHYGGFETYFNTHVKNGKRCLLVVFYYKGGFPNSKTAYLKIGQVNCGRIIGQIRFNSGTKYAFINVEIDDYLSNHGIVNIFPLVITNGSRARNYLNPITIKTKPLLDENWRNKYFGYEFGTINNVSVYYNKGKNLSIDDDAKYQCVELCRRYITDQYDFINRPYTSTWGCAYQWPDNRRNDEIMYGDKYMVIENDGHTRVREGDIIVWDHGENGHVGVVIKTAKQKNGSEYISVAHQNGGTGNHADPIGMTLQVVDKVIKNIRNGSNYAPIFTTSDKISHFIRVYNQFEEVSAYSKSMTASTTNLRFGKRVVGTSFTRKFTITNNGYSPLTISSMAFNVGKAYKINISSCTIGYGQTQEFEVTFTPKEAGDFEDRLIIRSDADDNPIWCIRLFGKGVESIQTEVITIPGTDVSFKMVAVEGGTFTMGATAEQGSDAYSDEKPAHQVTLSSYSIGQTEVTQKLWQAVMGSNPSNFTGDLSRPVECVSWNDCQEFIATLNEMTGKQFRLPTEAEWEFAARGGNLSQGYKYAGSNTIGDVAWYRVNAYDVGSTSPDYGTHAVATKAPNELGLYDMTGNVWEWCQDWYGAYSSVAQTNPTGPTSGSCRVYRGGSWSASARSCRVSNRNDYRPSYAHSYLGLRLAL